MPTGLTATANILRAVRPDAVEAFLQAVADKNHPDDHPVHEYDVIMVLLQGFTWSHKEPAHLDRMARIKYWKDVAKDVRKYMETWYE